MNVTNNAHDFKHTTLYAGKVRHRRFGEKNNSFTYKLYMLALDPDELIKSTSPSTLFGFSWFNPIRFVAADYLRCEQSQHKPNDSHVKDDLGLLKDRIKNKVNELLNKDIKEKESSIERVVMLVQARCFGVYFSPANFYFCYNELNECCYMLAEVSNTPWNKRHYYLIDLSEVNPITDKNFHVSPFMDMDMQYHWKIKPVEQKKENVLIHIENRSNDTHKSKLFDATLQMKKQSFTAKNLLHVWSTLPVMTVKICAGIYWQALKLLIKRVPFISYIDNVEENDHKINKK